jgi:DnaB-like helicase N terminal domain/AAA domain
MSSRTQTAHDARPMPHNLEAERSVLGAIVLDNAALGRAVQELNAGDFYMPQNRIIFASMKRLAAAAVAIDLVTLTEDLHRAGELEAAGGAAYVSALPDGLPRVTNVEHHARIVKEKAFRRNLIHSLAAIQEQTFDGTEDPGAILERVEQTIANLQSATAAAGEPAAWRDMFHSYAEFEESAQLSFAIGGFLQNAGATMIGGLSGHGKTLILCSITKALLAGRGTRLWDVFPVEENAVRVVYLIPECSLAPFKHRLKLFRIYDALAPNDDRLLVRTLSKGPTPCLSDPRILYGAKGAHVILDTAARFGEGDENSASDNSRGLANDIFALLASGARSVIAAHHSPKSFSKETMMTLENVLRGSGDVGAMLTTSWGIKQLDPASNIIHIENIKPRDFQPCAPFQIIGRPYIDEEGDFRILKRPGECGTLSEEQTPERDKGGASIQARETRAANMEILRRLLCESPNFNSQQISQHFRSIGIKLGDSSIRKYRKELGL